MELRIPPRLPWMKSIVVRDVFSCAICGMARRKKSHARDQMHSWPFYSCCLRGWRSSICGTSNRRLQRRHEEENDDEEAQEVPGNSISPRANTFPPGCLLCYILARRMGGLLKRLVVTFEHCPFFTLVNGEDWSYENLRANHRPIPLPGF